MITLSPGNSSPSAELTSDVLVAESRLVVSMSKKDGLASAAALVGVPGAVDAGVVAGEGEALAVAGVGGTDFWGEGGAGADGAMLAAAAVDAADVGADEAGRDCLVLCSDDGAATLLAPAFAAWYCWWSSLCLSWYDIPPERGCCCCCG